jgi:hypothetical protein
VVRERQAAGAGALAFGILTFVAVMLESSPGGTFKTSHVADYVKSGHRPAVFAATYLALLGIVGLAVLLTWLRSQLGEGTRSAVFWFLGVAGAGAWVAGWGVTSAVPMVMAYGGKQVTLPPTVTYALSTGGWAVTAGGAALVGLALLALTIAPSSLPAWVRWSTLVAGIAALAAYAWFPFFLVYLWAVVIGVWLLVGQREAAVQPAAAT